jgi:hypothetical protein
MTVRAVVFEIGGVLEKVGPPLSWLGPWQEELSLTPGPADRSRRSAMPATTGPAPGVQGWSRGIQARTARR